MVTGRSTAAAKSDLPPGEAGTSLGREAVRLVVRDPLALVGALLVLGFVLVAIFAPFLAPFGPNERVGDVTPTNIPGPSWSRRKSVKRSPEKVNAARLSAPARSPA